MALSKFFDVKNDIAFKRVFGTEKNKDILIHFLNDILLDDMFAVLDIARITEVKFLRTVQDPEIASRKQSVVDILCKDIKGVQYIIEMQVVKTKGFEKRAQYYAAKAYTNQVNQGEKYYNLKEIIFIAIADYVVFPNKEKYISYHSIRDIYSNENDLKDFYFVFIELPRFPKQKEDELDNIVEKWVYFFKYASETSDNDLERIIGDDEIIKKAYKELDMFYWSDEERNTYESEKKRILDEQAILEQKLDDATEKGMAEGMKLGAEKGRAEGKIEVARNLLKAGVTIEIIAKSTDLTVDEIKRLI